MHFLYFCFTFTWILLTTISIAPLLVNVTEYTKSQQWSLTGLYTRRSFHDLSNKLCNRIYSCVVHHVHFWGLEAKFFVLNVIKMYSINWTQSITDFITRNLSESIIASEKCRARKSKFLHHCANLQYTNRSIYLYITGVEYDCHAWLFRRILYRPA